MSKAKASKRNRHTKRVNDFKRNIIEKGEHFTLGDRVYAKSPTQFGTRPVLDKDDEPVVGEDGQVVTEQVFVNLGTFVRLI